jgi:calcineurin-like phosphoesterase family protein
MGVAYFKKTWFTSDWHVGHAKVLEFCKGTRGHLKDLEHMHAVLVENYNNTVKPEDTCFFLGDFAFKGVEHAEGVLKQMHGKKILIRGNHDKGHQSLKNMGFDAVMDAFELKMSGLYITASHFPLTGIKREKCEVFRSYKEGESWHGEYKYRDGFLVIGDRGQDIHLHGHIHSPNNGLSTKICGNQYDVGVDANDLKPVSLNHIIKQVHRNKPRNS